MLVGVGLEEWNTRQPKNDSWNSAPHPFTSSCSTEYKDTAAPQWPVPAQHPPRQETLKTKHNLLFACCQGSRFPRPQLGKGTRPAGFRGYHKDLRSFISPLFPSDGSGVLAHSGGLLFQSRQ